jgi:glycosyltransferase involved in cell wall biosynthesis
MKIANIIEEGRLGGPQIRIAEVACRLKGHGIETTVVYPKYQSDLFKERLEAYGIKNIRLPLHKLTKDKTHLLAYFIFFFYEIIYLYLFFKRERFDIIHCSGGSWQFKGIIAGKLAGSKTLWHLNDTGMPAFFRWIFRLIAPKFADGLIVAGKCVRKYYVEQLGIQKIPVFEVQAPVNTDYFDPSKRDCDKIISKANGLKIVTIANVNPTKGLDYFMHMAASLNKRYKKLNFFIVGPVYDTQKSYSKTLSKLQDRLRLDNLQFYGACRDVPSVLNAADIFVFSSISEASPMSVWEAMSMGKAIVSTDVGDVACFLKNEETGFVVPIKDAEALANKVSVLVENPDLRRKFGEKAREAACKYLDINVTTQKHIQAYRTVLNQR